MAAELPAHMAPFSFPNPFRSARCAHCSQETPPSLPEELAEHTVLHSSRMQFSKIFSKSRYSKKRPSARRGFNTDSVPQLPLTFHAIAHAAVKPVSPNLTEEGEKQEVPYLPKLRKIETSFTDLRATAQKQLEGTLKHVTPLLPSPPDHRHKHSIYSKSEDYSSSEEVNREIAGAEEESDDYYSYDDLRILSCYYGDEKLPVVSNQSSRGSIGHWEDAVQCRDRRMTTCSAESDWFADTKSYDERRKRFHQRCYQVVEHPSRRGVSIGDEAQHEIMLASIILGPGKPRLVQIQRPASATSSSTLSSIRPKTPDQAIHEVSAFSPYDTPPKQRALSLDTFSLSRSGSIISLLPAPLSFLSRRKSSVHRRSFLYDRENPERHLARIDSAVSMQSKSQSRMILKSQSQSSWASNSSIWTRQESYRLEQDSRDERAEQILQRVAEAIEIFPDGILRLDSDVILGIRMTRSDDTHISCLQKIFPDIATLLLSALAAWLLVDIYLSNINEQGRRASRDRLDYIPEKARAMLGLKPSQLLVSENALCSRADAVHASVGVIGHRLMEVIRGGWDEDLWKSLRVLVEVIEAGPP